MAMLVLGNLKRNKKDGVQKNLWKFQGAIFNVKLWQGKKLIEKNNKLKGLRG